MPPAGVSNTAAPSAEGASPSECTRGTGFARPPGASPSRAAREGEGAQRLRGCILLQPCAGSLFSTASVAAKVGEEFATKAGLRGGVVRGGGAGSPGGFIDQHIQRAGDGVHPHDVAVQHLVGVGGLHAGAQVLDALVQPMRAHLGKAHRLHRRAVTVLLAVQCQRIGRRAGAQRDAAGGGVADVTDGHVPGQAFDDFGAGEGVADKAEAAFGMEAAMVVGDDARGFLAAVLQGIEPVVAELGDVLTGCPNAEYAAFFLKFIAF